jgi:hypothetical protein
MGALMGPDGVREGPRLRASRTGVFAVRGGAPVSPNRSRKSIVTHHCPREVAPALFRIYAAP